MVCTMEHYLFEGVCDTGQLHVCELPLVFDVKLLPHKEKFIEEMGRAKYVEVVQAKFEEGERMGREVVWIVGMVAKVQGKIVAAGAWYNWIVRGSTTIHV